MAKAIRYGGFWRRLGAYIIDSLICIAILLFFAACKIVILMTVNKDLTTYATIHSITAQHGVVASAFLSIADHLASMLSIPLLLAYFVLQWSSSAQATLGMRVFGLKMVDYNHKRITSARGVGRLLAMVLSSLILCIGYLMIGFTKRKQGLHDKIAKTYVIRA